MADDPHPHESDSALDLSDVDWPAPQPPEGFATRTTALFFDADAGADTDAEPSGQEATEPRSPRLVRAAAVLTAAAAALAIWWLVPSRTQRDSVVATTVQTIAIGDRALAVANPGATVRWEIDGEGHVRVRQDAGRVFYRVEPGGAFDVETAAGVVRVTGTCFEVETKPMIYDKNLRAATLGAAIAGAVVVTVYEGGVVLANERGEIAVTPGQQATADGNGAPRRIDAAASQTSDPGATRDVDPVDPPSGDAVAQVRRQARALEQARQEQVSQDETIAKLRRQVTELGGEPGERSHVERKARARRCASAGRFADCSFLEPDDETLQEMARCASVKIDHPGFVDDLEPRDTTGFARALGISDEAEIAGMQAAANKHHARFQAELREIFLKLGGDAEMAESASAKTMSSFITDQLDRESVGEIQRRVAEERAGLREPPADLTGLPIEERMFRLHAELGNEFEALLAEQVGDERARELRRVQDGWPGSTSVHSGNCIDP